MACVLCFALASCAHECVFVSEWSSDDTSHWHACEKEKCEEIADKADHTWDEGVITTAATQEADGVKTFTCTVCKHTKTESVTFTGLTEEAWNAALADDLFKNFTYVTESKTVYGTETSEVKITYKFVDDKIWGKMESGDETEEESVEGTEATEYKNQIVKSIKEIAKFDSFKYDAATKTYIIDAEDKTDIGDVSIKFANGKLAEIKCSYEETYNEITTKVEYTISLSDYGTTVIS